MTMIRSNLQTVRARMEAACIAAGRDVQEVTLVAVSKTRTANEIEEAAHEGQVDFGENYVQEAVAKIEQLRARPLVWHCIGPVQSNKSRVVAENFDWIHTVDRLKLAQRLSEQRPSAMGDLQVCIQVNADGGANKSGVAPGEVLDLAKEISALPGLRLRGLMSIPEPQPDFESQKRIHMLVSALFSELKSEGFSLDTLSMGMSDDLEAAIHAGSTMVRIGTAVFGSR